MLSKCHYVHWMADDSLYQMLTYGDDLKLLQCGVLGKIY